MANTIPFIAMREKLDSTLANSIDQLEGEYQIALDLDVITDEETETIKDWIDQLEAIRGELNE